jgi:hypothetical protein
VDVVGTPGKSTLRPAASADGLVDTSESPPPRVRAQLLLVALGFLEGALVDRFPSLIDLDLFEDFLFRLFRPPSSERIFAWPLLESLASLVVVLVGSALEARVVNLLLGRFFKTAGMRGLR